MRDLSGKVAVITGAASGIGLAMAERFGQAGMKLALADVEAEALEQAEKTLASRGISVFAQQVDVSSEAGMDRFAATVTEAVGAPYLLCLNAGVSGGGGPIETLTTKDWAWGIDVNLWGVIHGLRAFLAGLKERDEGYVVVTSSIAGILASPQAAPYHATKNAVRAIAETLHRELRASQSRVGVSCLCPGLVSTNFPSGERNRPEALRNADAPALTPEQEAAMRDAVGAIFARGATTEHVAECVYTAVQQERFWIYTDEVHRDAIRARNRALEEGAEPPTDFGALDGY